MGLAYDKLTALAILRSRRSAGAKLGRRVDLTAPHLEQGKRWTRKAVRPERYCGQAASSKIYVAVPGGPARIRTAGVVSTVYTSGLPGKAFVSLGDGFSMASPELLFVEMGAMMSLPTQVMLGMEMCGTFSRDATDPRMGDVAYGVSSVTTTAKLTSFVESAKFVTGLNQSREAVQYVADNAWSPMEAMMATLAALPASHFGYDLGPARLNVRIEADGKMQALGAKASRVPDLLLADSPVGINYDGKGHFDLDGLVDSVRQADDDVDARKRELREKLVDDLRRTRELAAAGYVVLPATSEDLFAKGGLDALMLEAMCAIEHFGGRDLSIQKLALRNEAQAKSRQRLIWSLLPWEEATEHAREIMRRERLSTQGMTEFGYEIDGMTGEIRRVD